MIFQSFAYLFFLVGVAAVYYLMPSPRVQNLVLIAAGIGFLFSFAPSAALILLLTSFVSWAAALYRGSCRKLVFTLAVLADLSLLILLKYDGFLMGIFSNFVSGLPDGIFSIAVPVGISYYTLQTIGYLSDVKNGRYEPERNLLDYFTFVGFFPQLTAGPISRANGVLPQLKKRRNFDAECLRQAAARFLVGLFRKAVVADGIAIFVNAVWKDPGLYSSLTVAAAACAYALQIYFDFCGYSDMAIASAQFLGIKLPENFSAPYLSKSVGELWSRWHMSLSGWLRDYIYFPLGGSRKGFARKLFNVAVVFVVSGMWHGTTVNFLVWGALHALFRLAEELWVRAIPPIKGFAGNLLGRLWVFSSTAFAFVFFRAPDLPAAASFLQRLVSGAGMGPIDTAYTAYLAHFATGVSYIKIYLPVLALSLAFLLLWEVIREKRGEMHRFDPVSALPDTRRFALCMILLILILLFGEFGSSSFIYFQF